MENQFSFFPPYLPPDYGPAKFSPLQIQPPRSFQTLCNERNPPGNLAEYTTTSPIEDINEGVWLKGKPVCSLLTSAVNWNASMWSLPFDLNESWLVSQCRQKSCFLLLKWNACFWWSFYWGQLREGKGKGHSQPEGWLRPRGSKCGAIIARVGRVQQIRRWGESSGVPTDPPHCASGPGFLLSCRSFFS